MVDKFIFAKLIARPFLRLLHIIWKPTHLNPPTSFQRAASVYSSRGQRNTVPLSTKWQNGFLCVQHFIAITIKLVILASMKSGSHACFKVRKTKDSHPLIALSVATVARNVDVPRLLNERLEVEEEESDRLSRRTFPLLSCDESSNV